MPASVVGANEDPNIDVPVQQRTPIADILLVPDFLDPCLIFSKMDVRKLYDGIAGSSEVRSP